MSGSISLWFHPMSNRNLEEALTCHGSSSTYQEPYAGLILRVGSTHLSGDGTYAEVMPLTFLVELLQTVFDLKIERNQEYVPFFKAPGGLLLEPINGSIKLTKLYGEEGIDDAEKRLGIEKSADVELEEFTDEVIASADQYSELLENIGVGMESESVEQLHQLLDEAHNT